MYDKILVDAPCSGLGVLRHKPEIKYEQSQQSIQSLVNMQLEILNNVKESLRPGGTLVYSCLLYTSDAADEHRDV